MHPTTAHAQVEALRFSPRILTPPTLKPAPACTARTDARQQPLPARHERVRLAGFASTASSASCSPSDTSGSHSPTPTTWAPVLRQARVPRTTQQRIERRHLPVTAPHRTQSRIRPLPHDRLLRGTRRHGPDRSRQRRPLHRMHGRAVLLRTRTDAPRHAASRSPPADAPPTAAAPTSPRPPSVRTSPSSEPSPRRPGRSGRSPLSHHRCDPHLAGLHDVEQPLQVLRPADEPVGGVPDQHVSRAVSESGQHRLPSRPTRPSW